MKHRDYKIAINPKYDRYHRGLASIVYKFFDKKTGSGAKASVNEGLAQELHKPVIKKFKTRKLYATFKNIIWPTDLTEMRSLSSKNRVVKYLLCMIDVYICFPKYAWVRILKDKKSKIVLNGFIEILNKSKRQPNKYGLIKEKHSIIVLCKNG